MEGNTVINMTFDEKAIEQWVWKYAHDVAWNAWQQASYDYFPDDDDTYLAEEQCRADFEEWWAVAQAEAKERFNGQND